VVPRKHRPAIERHFGLAGDENGYRGIVLEVSGVSAPVNRVHLGRAQPSVEDHEFVDLETRHVASWLGGQEALHEKVLTLDGALAELDAVTADGIQALAARLIVEDGLRLAVVAPPRRGRRLESLLRLPGGSA
jgi:hypothetical protein